MKRIKRTHAWKGFTLIELLIVIAIILILISIALPNFLEAQVRAKVAKASAETKSLVTATEAYKGDWKGHEPIPWSYEPGNSPDTSASFKWWGFASLNLTTPTKYMSHLPTDPFGDSADIEIWWRINHKLADPPYTVIRMPSDFAKFKSGQSITPGNAAVKKAAGGNVFICENFVQNVRHCGYFYYSSGPDNCDATCWVAPTPYSPTNGTNSFGDIYAFGPGNPFDDDNAHLRKK